MNMGSCNPKFITMALSLILIPAIVHPTAPIPCIKMLEGKIFRLVRSIPKSTKSVLVHFKTVIISNLLKVKFRKLD